MARKGPLIYLWEDPDHLQVSLGPALIKEAIMTAILAPHHFKSPDEGPSAKFNAAGNVRAFVEAILADKEMRPNFQDGLQNQEILEAVEIPAHDRCWVDLPLNS